ncbi:MAG: prolyl oligopeptidase family serine peptidase [Luteolibacter sp.]|uniref:carboxylesterase family protein n=1 Tax=Luteolibacter sp. TaxID=1962973 RepID=UPI0032659F2F
MKVRDLAIGISLLTFTLIPNAGAREWISTDGKKLDAELVSSEGGQVKLKRATDGQVFTLPLARLSAADQAWLKEQPVKPAAAPKAIEGPFAKLITGDWALSERDGLPFSFYASKDLSAEKTYPLILALHGKSTNNENGKQVAGWMKTFTTSARYSKNPCFIVAPLAYQPFGGTGSGWNDKPGVQTVDLVKELIKSLPIDKNRIYIIGHSMGGFGTCHLINTEPRLFAAGVAVAGCTGPDTASSFKKVPLWLFHAADDNIVDVKSSRELAKALEHSKECKYTEYPTGGHGVVGKVFDDEATHDWLFAQGVKK